ncbi:MAG: universal stress protein [Spirochaetes bacterium]|nr:MAG: universal stress protein [Spirochaetota bacterium]
MYKNILLLLDCSPVDRVIVNHIKELAKYHKSRVHIFHVVHAHTLDQERAMTVEVKECFSEVLSVFEKEKINVDYSIVEGEPAEEVLKKATEPAWDLIALATHGHKTFGDFIYGSVSDVLKHKANKPLLLIHG